MTGASRIPLAVSTLARILVSGSLDELHPAWSGWTINRRTGELVDPHGMAHTPESIRVWHWTAQELNRLRGEENQLSENVTRIRTGREGHALTIELHRRLSLAVNIGDRRDIQEPTLGER